MLKKLGKYTGEKILVYNEYIRKAIISLNLLIQKNRIDWYATSRFLLSHKKEKNY